MAWYYVQEEFTEEDEEGRRIADKVQITKDVILCANTRTFVG